MTVLSQLGLDSPPESLELNDTTDGSCFASLGLVGGGLALYELPP